MGDRPDYAGRIGSIPESDCLNSRTGGLLKFILAASLVFWFYALSPSLGLAPPFLPSKDPSSFPLNFFLNNDAVLSPAPAIARVGALVAQLLYHAPLPSRHRDLRYMCLLFAESSRCRPSL